MFDEKQVQDIVLLPVLVQPGVGGSPVSQPLVFLQDGHNPLQVFGWYQLVDELPDSGQI